MTLRIRKYIVTLLDVYIPGMILFAMGQLIDRIAGNDLMNIYLIYYFGFIWSVILMKDIFAGQSIFKKLFGLKIVSIKTGYPIKSIVAILRNFAALPIFPIEIIMYILFRRRIGDLIFSTEVIETERMEIKSILNELRNYGNLKYIKDFAISFVLAIIGLTIYIYLLSELFKQIN